MHGDNMEIEQIVPYLAPTASLIFGGYVYYSRWSDKKKHQQYVKKVIDNNIRDLVKITRTIHSKSENVYNSDEAAMMLESYFTRHVRRLELLRLNIENNLPQLTDESSYTNSVVKMLEIESWLVDKFDDPTVSKNKRFYLWKECSENSELTNKTRDLVNIATKLNIEKPVSIT